MLASFLMYNYHSYLVLKQHMKFRVKSEDIDLHTLSVLKQHTCFYSVRKNVLSKFGVQSTNVCI